MKSWKRISVTAAVVANVLVLIAPGAVIVWQAVRYATVRMPPISNEALLLALLIGLPLVLIGSFNLLCVRTAHTARGKKQQRAIKRGLISCVVLAIIGLALMAPLSTPLPLLFFGAVAYVTSGALCQPRAQPPPEWQCPMCEYDMRGLSGTVCPECGNDASNKEGPD